VIDVLVTVGSGVIGLTVIGFAGGALLQYASKAFKVEGNPLVESIDELLHKHSVANVDILGANPTQRPLHMENPSIVAHQVARPLSIELRRYWVWNRSLLMPTQLLLIRIW